MKLYIAYASYDMYDDDFIGYFRADTNKELQDLYANLGKMYNKDDSEILLIPTSIESFNKELDRTRIKYEKMLKQQKIFSKK